MTFLEKLVAQWYEHQDYLVITNRKVGKRKKGGYDGEMDVVAFDPKKKELIHIEVSFDFNAWGERARRIRKKFKYDDEEYRQLFPFNWKTLRKVAVYGSGQRQQSTEALGIGNNIELWSVRELMRHVTEYALSKNPHKEAIPEQYDLLRAIQFTKY